MAKAANGKAMKARRRKRFVTLDPIYERQREIIAARMQAHIDMQNGKEPETPAPPVDQWVAELRQTPAPVAPFNREEIDADVEALKKQLLPY
ncbi:hypothetical protein TVAG_163420 [Trichomonas vaginalis G3]|uniref:Uncharacterized protein n=1 Tax=Trichomonas vaginalis (strain ATCC PRA-98 / G3) TaxID=412133 RepID=A2DG19_TRIV3|nr:hypothetical protein TVAGG3_0953360 [Trichomonas vaginalis G3]EAY20646.1 hypothetical protein TVAG_163420 [Trichomonas vaginalis G3]KAI5487367.1 hypothetical protein TVAGG3_0953360 [Trichomonas vaginalis G3]|eukprot:XP_001581632.1 hypothetical protein [Trichomonas vaginalis G3]